jgi:hypothetical protein
VEGSKRETQRDRQKTRPHINDRSHMNDREDGGGAGVWELPQ